MIGSILNKMFFLLTEADVAVDGIEDTIAFSTGGMPSWPPVIITVLCVVLAVVCSVLTVIILLQKKRASGIGAAIAGSGETYWSRNKGKSMEGTLEKYTKWGGFAFLVIALLINVFM